MKPTSILQSLNVVFLLCLFASAAAAQTPSADGDDKVTGQAYVRHDGGTDAGHQHCNNTATDPAADDNLNDSDVDSNDGGTRRQANEPFSVVDPTDPDTVVAGWNDYCLTDLGAGWQGFAYSHRQRRDLDRLARPRLPAGHLGGGHGKIPRCSGPTPMPATL